jgi:RING finger protein 113A
MEEPQSVLEIPIATFRKRAPKSKSTRKRAESPPTNAKSDSDLASSEDEDGRRVKRQRKKGGLTANSAASETHTTVNLPAPKPAALVIDKNDATKASNWFDERAPQLSSKKVRSSADPSPNLPPQAGGIYKGQANYQSFIHRNPDAPSKQVGPVKSSTNVRTITVTDFAPDVCKDYKQTGFCAFGETCKFLHARENYKQGWELDRDWEIGTKGKKVQKAKTVASATRTDETENEDQNDDALLESIPFACIICRKAYKNPITTKCGHYYCEACALQRYRKNPSCAACGAGTGGVFNVAKKLSKLLEKKRERAKKRKEEALAKGEEVSDSADDD